MPVLTCTACQWWGPLLARLAHLQSLPCAGFRSPYLVHNPSVRQVLYENGFLYDSSIDELFPSATSSDISHRLYPYSWDYGIPQARVCPAQHCQLPVGLCFDWKGGSVLEITG